LDFASITGSTGFTQRMTSIPTKIEVRPPAPDIVEKENALRVLMRRMGRVLVAYSGGVDSTYLAYLANSELGANSLSILGVSPSVSNHQRDSAIDVAEQFGLNFRIIKTDEVSDPSYSANPVNRCYFCKSELYQKLSALAESELIEFIIDGTNADDLSDHRPGRIAADEKNVRSPLAEAGLSKSDIRELSGFHGLPTWDQPASPCLSSRIAHGIPVTIGRLSKIEEGEDFLRRLGFREFRLRVHGELARIEIAKDEFDLVLTSQIFDTISTKIKELGFRYVTLDMEGFRSGALNESLIDNKQKT
jgi:uncharacterized protein